MSAAGGRAKRNKADAAADFASAAPLPPPLALLLLTYKQRAQQEQQQQPVAAGGFETNGGGIGGGESYLASDDMPDPALFDTHELVSAGKIGPKGVRWTLSVCDARDLDRTVMRSDAATLSLPALKVDNPDGTGRMATVRDVLKQMRDGVEQGLSFAGQLGTRQGQTLLNSLRDCCEASGDVFELVLDDPLGVSRISARDGHKPGEQKDTQLKREEYTRSWDAEEEFGLHMRYAIDTKLQSANSTAAHLAALIAKAKRVVAFTGAGISTESDIPAFWIDDKERQLRSVWNSYPHDKFTEPNLMTNSEIRTAYWGMTFALFATMQRANPNAAHKFFPWLYDRRCGPNAGPDTKEYSVTVITQNIDALHTRAGLNAAHVHELHGCMWTVTCRACGTQTDHPRIHARVKAGETDPHCTVQVPVPVAVVAAVAAAKDQKAAAGAGAGAAAAKTSGAQAKTMTCGGVLLPDVVHFGAKLRDDTWAKAVEAVQRADLLIGIGSSFFVAPANTLPGMAIQRGIPFVLLNKSNTKFDAFATVRMTEPCGQILAAVQQILSGGGAGAAPAPAVGAGAAAKK